MQYIPKTLLACCVPELSGPSAKAVRQNNQGTHLQFYAFFSKLDSSTRKLNPNSMLRVVLNWIILSSLGVDSTAGTHMNYG